MGQPSRRLTSNVVDIAGKPWNLVSSRVHELISKLLEMQVNTTTDTTILARQIRHFTSQRIS